MTLTPVVQQSSVEISLLLLNYSSGSYTVVVCWATAAPRLHHLVCAKPLRVSVPGGLLVGAFLLTLPRFCPCSEIPGEQEPLPGGLVGSLQAWIWGLASLLGSHSCPSQLPHQILFFFPQLSNTPIVFTFLGLSAR